MSNTEKKQIFDRIFWDLCFNNNLKSLNDHNEIYNPKTLNSGIWRFDSLKDIIKYTKNNLNLKLHLSQKGASIKNKISKEPSFFGNISFDKAIEDFYRPPLATRQLIEDINFEIESEKEKGYFSDTEGLSFDVGSVLSGEPECWLNQKKKPVKKIELFLNPAVNCKITDSQIKESAKKIISIISFLEEKGYKVKLNYLLVSSTNIIYSNLKDYFDSLDLDDLMYCLNTSFFRCIILNLFQNSVGCTKTMGSVININKTNVLNSSKILIQSLSEIVEDLRNTDKYLK